MGVFVLLLSLGTIFWLSRNVVLFDSKAALSNTPKDIQISNITQNSATVSFVTDGEVMGSVTYGKNPSLGQVAFDTRDSASQAPHAVHYIVLSGLDPGTEYFFSIVSGDGVFQNDKTPYELTTAPSAEGDSSKPLTISGKVTTDGTTAPSEAIVYVKSDGSQVISVLLKPDGSYKLDIPKLLKKDLSGVLALLDTTVLKMNVNDSHAASQVSFFANSADPIPPIILSKDYDFTGGGIASTTASESAQVTGFPVLEGGETTVGGPQILTPKTDEKFEDQQPLFEGVSQPGADVEITIESDPITTTVQADSSGNWQFRPDTKLTPGVHKITIKTLNAQGILQSLTRSFTVNAQGSQFIEPSISPTSAPSISPTAKPSPNIPTPTSLPTATIPPTLAPTIQPTAIVIVPTTVISVPISPSTNITVPPVPDSGSSALVFGIIGTILTIGIGGLIFLLL
ncbi:MAG TPA: Ig-like domain-containing protein [Xanthomonadales bacterium]|nr:Ig-like domain-containing protein [Xanthomonadales bacterium]